jgi:lipopolysaccharide export system protein LptA
MVRLGRQATALIVLGASILAGSTFVPHRALAQAGGGGAFGAGNGPIDISADEVEVIDAERRGVWRGNVEAIQGVNRMRAPVLTIYFAPARAGAAAGSGPGAGWGDVQRMEADGPVYYVTPQQNARGDHATYEAATNTMTMTGNVVLVQDKNVVQGDKLTVDTKTNHSVLVSNNAGRGGKRVRGVFYPSNAAQAAPAPAARP